MHKENLPPLQVASLEEEIEILGNQVANLGVDIVPYETSYPYFATQSICSDQQSGTILQNQACCSHMELQHSGTADGISEGLVGSSIFERLIEELNQDYYLLEDVSQAYCSTHTVEEECNTLMARN